MCYKASLPGLLCDKQFEFVTTRDLRIATCRRLNVPVTKLLYVTRRRNSRVIKGTILHANMYQLGLTS